MELFVFPFLSRGAIGSGANIIFTRVAWSLGSSGCVFGVVSIGIRAFSWMRGLMLALITVISWSGLIVLDSLPSNPHAVAIWSWAISKLSKISATTF